MRKNISELEQEEGVVWDLIDDLVDNAVVCIVMSCYFYKLYIWHIHYTYLVFLLHYNITFLL